MNTARRKTLFQIVLVFGAITASAYPQAIQASGPSLILERNPYLQLSTPTSIIIQWRTETPSDSHVQFGLDAENLTHCVDDAGLTTEHSVTLTGLTPDATYYYAVGSSTQTIAGPDAEHSFRSAPSIGTPKPVRVWVIGDAGVGSPGARDVRDAYLAHAADRPADVWLMLGDNAYLLGSDTDFQTRMFDIYPSILRTTASWPAIGNHDVLDNQRPYFDIFTLPDNAQAGGLASNTELYYSFDYANIHFVCLDTTLSDFTPGSPMLDWLAADLAATTQDWAIAYFHHPPYSDGHDSDTEEELIEVRQNIIPILEAGGVDLVLSGHSHSYERSYLLNGHYGPSSTLTPAMLIDDGNGQEDGDGAYTKSAPGLTPNSGTVYAVAGNAGQVTGTERDHPAMFVSQLELGSMVIDIHNTRLDAVSINDQGVINDHFTILKPAACPPDLNNDGAVDFFDISQFLVTRPDWNNDTAFDFFDINGYLTAYSAGCP